MFKKLFVAALWFVSVSMVYSLVAYVVGGLPSGGGPVLGVLVAAFIVMDPSGILFDRQASDPAADTRTGAPQTN
jgi:hypothetical protein